MEEVQNHGKQNVVLIWRYCVLVTMMSMGPKNISHWKYMFIISMRFATTLWKFYLNKLGKVNFDGKVEISIFVATCVE